jgi:carbon storage regulator
LVLRKYLKEEIMLVLTRTRGKRIVVGDDIVITVVDICGDRVKLGFSCPDEIPVHREEVFRRIHENELIGPQVQVAEAWDEPVDVN